MIFYENSAGFYSFIKVLCYADVNYLLSTGVKNRRSYKLLLALICIW